MSHVRLVSGPHAMYRAMWQEIEYVSPYYIIENRYTNLIDYLEIPYNQINCISKFVNCSISKYRNYYYINKLQINIINNFIFMIIS